ncbi:MAG TPA: hypothetical protein VNA89_15065 [Gemmatimonadaceae bacterium]|nr:hypothetical protein [Gemmatimonadaceae bacterium]
MASYIESLPPREQVTHLKRWILAGSVGCIALTAMTAQSLYDLETGVVAKTKLWFPIAMMYELFGFWAATISPLAIGALIIIAGIRRLRRAQTEVAKAGRAAGAPAGRGSRAA